MSTTTSIVESESLNAYREAKATALTLKDSRLAEYLEASGPLLKLAGVSREASETVHAYRVARDTAGGSPSKMLVELYDRARKTMSDLLASGQVDKELGDVIQVELRRSDAFISEAAKAPTRFASRVELLPGDLSKESSALLQSWATRMKSGAVDDTTRDVYLKMVSRIPPTDPGWVVILETAQKSAERVKARHGALTRDTYATNDAARSLIDVGYASVGKGAMFEPTALGTDIVKSAVDSELRGAAHHAGAKSGVWQAKLSHGDLQLGTTDASGAITEWRKFSDSAVLVVSDKVASGAGAGAVMAKDTVQIDGIAQATALFEIKTERGLTDTPRVLSEITGQQERAMDRMVGHWDSGRPVYLKVAVTDQSGVVSTKTYLLQPPDPKAGLSYYGVGSWNADIPVSDVLATQGAVVNNMYLDISNDEMRAAWNELFWTAYESLK